MSIERKISPHLDFHEYLSGIVFGFMSGLFFSSYNADTAWRYMFAMGAILPTILIILVFTVMPESPRWLVQKERYDEAKKILKQIYGPGMETKVEILYRVL